MNIYSKPEAFGLEVVADLEVGESYEFDMTVVWKNQLDELFWAWDSGCSCPTPFEAMTLDDLRPINSYSDFKALADHVHSKSTLIDGYEFLAKVARLVHESWS